jgi:hypothetical protein
MSRYRGIGWLAGDHAGPTVSDTSSDSALGTTVIKSVYSYHEQAIAANGGWTMW